MGEYENDIILVFMCGSHECWEEQILDTRPDAKITWLGDFVANVTSDEKSLVNIYQEIIKKHYEPHNDIFPCISYCRSELVEES
jgi:tRNA G37 N-methylase TrmD